MCTATSTACVPIAHGLLTVMSPRARRAAVSAGRGGGGAWSAYIDHARWLLILSTFVLAIRWCDRLAGPALKLKLKLKLACLQVYGNYFHAANATGQELYLASWSAYIAARRNHPSMLVWTLCNEMWVPPDSDLAPVLAPGFFLSALVFCLRMSRKQAVRGSVRGDS